MYHYSIAPHKTRLLADKIALCRALGVSNLELAGEIDGVPFDQLDHEALEDARQALILSGVRVVLATLSADLADDGAVRRFFKAAYQLHVESVLLPAPVGEDLEAYVKACTPAARYARSYGMGLLVTNFTEGTLQTDEAVTQVVRALAEFDCGTVFDGVAHQKRGVYPFFGACYYSHIKNQIRVLRMGDVNANNEPVRLDHGLCGLREVTSLLLARSFDGYFSLTDEAVETFADWENLLADTRQMLAKL